MTKDDLAGRRTQSVGTNPGLVLLLSDDVRRYLTLRDCIRSMEAVFLALAEGRAVQPLRHVVQVPDRAGALYAMPGFLGTDGGGALAVKMVTLFPGNAGRGLHTHQGAIVLFDASDGRVLAVIEAASVTAIRTAAVSALATRLLARPDAADLALLGAGVQAESHLAAMLAVRPLRRVRIWSRAAERARAFARSASERHGIEVETAASPEAALRGATLICTVTGSPVPLTRSDWIVAGAHINAVGASTAEAREIDSATVARARIVVDSREAALAEAGDLLIPMAEGVLASDERLDELGDIVAGRVAGRESESDITLFESLGLAVEDVAAARTVYERALAAGVERVRFQ